jgi:hypothetical protein
MAERFLVNIPGDGALDLPKEEQRRRAGGRMRLPVPLGSLNVPPSVYIAERIRRRLLSSDRHRDATIVSLLAYAGLKPAERALASMG